MRGLRFDGYGGPEVLRWDDVPEPVPGPGELLVRVRAFAVNWADLLQRAGRYPGSPTPPYVMGHDVTGEVVGHGPGVTGPPAGTRVFGVLGRPGTAAEYVAAPAAWLYPVPDRLDDVTAAGAAGPYLTADAAIVTMGRLQPGEDVLVHAAAGAYGSAAAQLCRAYGAGRIIGTAGSPAKVARLGEWGVDVAVDYTDDDFVAVVDRVTGGRGVPLVLESVGGTVLERSFDCVAPAGRLVSVGASAGSSTRRFRLQTLFETGIAVAGFTLGDWLNRYPELVAPSVTRVLDAFASGAAAPVIGAVFPADRVADAHAFLEGRQSIGRTVVEMP